MSRPPPQPSRGQGPSKKSADEPRTSGAAAASSPLSAFNPYSLDASGWVEPTITRAVAYERGGPPADPRAAAAPSGERAVLERQLDDLRKAARPLVAVETLFQRWLVHPRRAEVGALFPLPRTRQRRAALAADVASVRVRSARGEVTELERKVHECGALTPIEADRILDVLTELRHAWTTREADSGYDDINWRHTCQEVGQILDVAEENGLDPMVTEDAVLASLFSDAAKLKGNFLTHHIDGAVAAAIALPRHLDVSTAGGRARLVSICQAILEHQVGPPRFMAQMVRMGIEEKLRVDGGSRAGLESLHAKIADPLNSDHVLMHPDGYGVLRVDEQEEALLARVGLSAWYVPHPCTPWFFASSAVIDADSLVNYVTPDGVGKIVAICGPGTPFRDPTVFHSMFSCGASFVDAVSVMSDGAMPAMRAGVQRTREVIDEVRAKVLAELQQGWLRFPVATLETVLEEEDVDVRFLTWVSHGADVLVDVPAENPATLPYWSRPLDYETPGAALEFAKLIRRRVADLLREP